MYNHIHLFVYLCACVRACVRECVRACVCVVIRFTILRNIFQKLAKNRSVCMDITDVKDILFGWLLVSTLWW